MSLTRGAGISSGAEPSHPKPGRPDMRLIALLAAGHLVVDTNQGAVPAILPFIKSSQSLSYTAVGALMLASSVTSSVMQPLFGFFSDRSVIRWLLPAAICLACGGMGLAGMSGSYWMTMALLIVMGLGVAAYHPEGYRTASSVAGRRKATAISWFSVGGNLGLALGPPMITFLVLRFGLAGSLGMMPLALAVAFLLFLFSRTVPSPAQTARAVPEAARARNRPGAMAILILLVAVRSWAQIGFVTYLPFYYIDYLKEGPEKVASLLFVFLAAGAAGTLIGGPVADRWGVKRFTIFAFLVAAPLGFLFLESSGFMAYVILGLFGASLVATFTTTVVMGQAFLPRNEALASGLIVGFAIGAGGLAVTLLGWIADLHGVHSTLWVSAVMPLLALLISTLLPWQPTDGTVNAEG